jgi:ubiquinone/menaquinone biosynthesis C-methylase UbiE
MRNFKLLLFNGLSKRRGDKIADLICPFLKDGASVLDFGCADMSVAEAVQRRKNVRVSGIDVIDMNMTDLPFKVYDGVRIPFKDKHFDQTYISFVLHHTDSIEPLLRECIRVTRKRIVILEDVYCGKLGLVLTKGMDYIANKLVSGEISVPLNFKTENDWVRLFRKLRAKRVKSLEARLGGLDIVKHRQFVIDLK